MDFFPQDFESPACFYPETYIGHESFVDDEQYSDETAEFLFSDLEASDSFVPESPSCSLSASPASATGASTATTPELSAISTFSQLFVKQDSNGTFDGSYFLGAEVNNNFTAPRAAHSSVPPCPLIWAALPNGCILFGLLTGPHFAEATTAYRFKVVGRKPVEDKNSQRVLPFFFLLLPISSPNPHGLFFIFFSPLLARFQSSYNRAFKSLVDSQGVKSATATSFPFRFGAEEYCMYETAIPDLDARLLTVTEAGELSEMGKAEVARRIARTTSKPFVRSLLSQIRGDNKVAVTEPWVAKWRLECAASVLKFRPGGSPGVDAVNSPDHDDESSQPPAKKRKVTESSPVQVDSFFSFEDEEAMGIPAFEFAL